MSAISRGETPKRPNDHRVTDRRWSFIQQCWSSSSTVDMSPLSEDVVEFAKNDLTSNDGSTQPAVPTRSETSTRMSGSFGKMTFNSILTPPSLSRTNTNDDEKDKEKESRGRSSSRSKPRSSLGFPATTKDKDKDRETASLNSKESFGLRRQSLLALRALRSRDRERDPSPAPLPLEESDSESIIPWRSLGIRPKNAFTEDGDSGSENAYEETEDEDEWIDDDGAAMDSDTSGERVNAVVPPEPYFPSTLNRGRGKRAPKSKNQENLPLSTSRPLFQRDRCTITVTQGHPESSGRRKRRYAVASDLSDESRYAVEWGIGTVLRDGDELCASRTRPHFVMYLPHHSCRLIITVVENENKGGSYFMEEGSGSDYSR